MNIKDGESMKDYGIRVCADEGKHFVLTEYGYEKTQETVKHERAIGKPVKLFEEECPKSWVKKGYVEEVYKE